jgi:hypothetical protein
MLGTPLLTKLGEPEVQLVLPLDEFFEWADDGSIGYNLCIPDALPLLLQTFQQILYMDEVDEIFIRIMDINEGMDEEWFSSDTVYVIGTLTKEKLWEIMNAVKPDISPDDIAEGWYYSVPVNIPYDIPESKVLSMWWD